VTKGRKAAAELLGTFWLVFGGCGAAVLAGHHLDWLGVSFAFGLTVVSMAYAVGHISGCHLNPAVSVGLVVAGREKPDILATYVPAQCLGALLAAVAIVAIAMGVPNASYADLVANGLAANGFGEHSPGKYGLGAAFLAEAVLTFFFLMVILGATDKRSNPAMAGLVIGLALTLIHMVGIPVTNLSVNPARSTGPAILVGGWALGQLWLFWVAPLVGAVAAGVTYKCLSGECPAPTPPTT
jgi:aquaporin Z